MSVSAEVAATLVKGDDGYYHIGDKNGDLVFVVLTKSVGKYTNGIIYTEEVKGVTPMPYVIDVTSAADKAAANKGNTYKDYRNVLRGFDEYKVVAAQGSDTIKLVKPDITVEKYYANFVNSDGAYPLDDVLKEFLIGAAATLGNDWCFACYYYGVQQNDPIVGEYVTEDNIFTLTIDENGTFTVYDVEGDVAVETGTWSKSGSTYSFVCDNAALMNSSLVYANGQFTYSDDYGAPVTFEKSAK
ncbi:MAG: hypothetical protein K2L88_04970 [Clostridiales bacterium]|nr:hypothetical protein [Clostridiales bacterium]